MNRLVFYIAGISLSYILARYLSVFSSSVKFSITFLYLILFMVCLVYFHRWIAVKEKVVSSVKSFKKSNVGILSIFVGAGVFAIGFSYSLPFLMILAMPIFWYADNKLTQPVDTLQAVSELMSKLLEESQAGLNYLAPFGTLRVRRLLNQVTN